MSSRSSRRTRAGTPIRAIALAAAATTLSVCAAQAAPTVPETFTYTAAIPNGFAGTAGTANATDFSDVIALPQISPANDATITSISVALAGNVFGDYTVTNKVATTISNLTAYLKAQISVFSPDGTTLGVVLPLTSKTFTLGPKQTVSQSNLSGSASNSQTTDSSNANFAAIASSFLGSGTVDLPVEALGLSGYTGASNITFDNDTFAGATATVTVNYLIDAPPSPDPIPYGNPVSEPGSVALLGLGLIALGTLARARRWAV